MKIYTALESVLRKEPGFVADDGTLKKWVVITKAQNYDTDLITLLLEDVTLKAEFFIPIKSALVFNQTSFIHFLEQKNYLNDSYTVYSNKIGLNIDRKYLNQRNEVVLVWPFKDCILEGGQSREEDKRQEIFFNQTLAQDEINQLLEPKVLTNVKHYTADGEKVIEKFNRNAQSQITDNLIVKGNNLLALHSLKKDFAGKVKLIYIDPPYNTGNDSFKYNDSFNHATWLTFMRNRLEVAKEFLRHDGLIFIHLDNIEEAYLKVACDEIFGRENYINTIAVRSSTASGMKTAHRDKTIIKQKDFILVYSKTKNFTLKPQYIKKDKWDSHYIYFFNQEENKVLKLSDVLKREGILLPNQKIEDLNLSDKKFYDFYAKNADRIFQTAPELPTEIKAKSLEEKDVIIKYGIEGDYNYAINGRRMTFLSKTLNLIYENQTFKNDLSTLLCDIWYDIDFQNTQNEGGISFPAGKKPEFLLQRIIDMTTKEGDLILDYHLGSGTTAAVAHKMNRQYIGIEQLDYGDHDSVKRLQNVIGGEQSGVSKAYNWKGGGDFVYLELKKYNQDFIEKIESAKNLDQLLKVWELMKTKSFLNYNVNLKKQEEHINEFKQLTLEMQKHHLLTLLDKNQLYVNLSSLNDQDFEITTIEKQVTADFYQINS